MMFVPCVSGKATADAIYVSQNTVTVCALTGGIKLYDIQMRITAQVFHAHVLILTDIFPQERQNSIQK